MRRTIVLVVVAALAALCAGCGVGTQSNARLLDKQSIPYGLLSPDSTTTSTVAVPAAQVTVYFESSKGLVAVKRSISAGATVKAALSELTKGPTAAEASNGLQSPISTVTPLTVKRIQNGIVSIDLPSSFASLGGQDQIIAAAQLVYTATAIAGVTAVTVLIGGQPAQVPAAGGALAPGPLTRGDYVGLSAG